MNTTFPVKEAINDQLSVPGNSPEIIAREPQGLLCLLAM